MALPASSITWLFCGAGALSNFRAWLMFSARLVLANKP